MTARRIENDAGEVFVSVDDLKILLREDNDLLLAAAAVLKVANMKGDPVEEQIRRMVGVWIAIGIGDMPRSPVDSERGAGGQFQDFGRN